MPKWKKISRIPREDLLLIIMNYNQVICCGFYKAGIYFDDAAEVIPGPEYWIYQYEIRDLPVQE